MKELIMDYIPGGDANPAQVEVSYMQVSTLISADFFICVHPRYEVRVNLWTILV